MARSRDTIRGVARLKPPKKSFMSGAAKGDNVVAYCHNNKHKGTLSAGMIKKHECNKKQCPYLEKYEYKPYWLHRKCIAALKKYHKNGRTGVIIVDGRIFFKPNETALYEYAKSIGKYGKVPEIIYQKDLGVSDL